VSGPRPDAAFFEQAEHPIAFDAACLEEAERAARRPIDGGLPDLGRCICVDAAATEDADDGFRLRPRSDGSVEVTVVATHPVGAMPIGSLVEREARRRGSSIYTPWADVPMVPDVLSKERLSLRGAQAREVVAATGRYADDGRLIAYSVQLGAVRIVANLTYGQAELRMDADAFDERDALAEQADADHPVPAEVDDVVHWETARLWTLVRRRWRERAGAINSDFSTVRARVDGDSLSLHRRQRDLWSHRLVAELNIAFNEMIGLFCEREGVWCAWRVQEAVDVSEVVQRWRQHPDDDLRRYMLSRAGRRTETKFAPGRHDGLGVERYAQASSALRRYGDYVLHAALGAALGGEVPDAEAWTRLLHEGEEAARRARSVMSSVQRYWLLRWFEVQGDRPFAGVWVEPGRGDRATVLLRETLSTVRVRHKGAVDVGAPVWVRVVRANPRQLQIEAECVPEPSEPERDLT
jgi:exoribonuclease-2